MQNFDNLHPDGRRLIISWLDRAVTEGGSAPLDFFERFIYLWIAFNGWAACVTAQDRDSEMIRRVSNCPDLRDCFLGLLQSSRNFSITATAFANLWPIFKAQDLRRRHVHQRQYNTRAELINHYLQAGGIDHQPECWTIHRERDETVPVDWPHTINAVYRVRCNLFHGEKSPHSEMDAAIVRAAYDVLSQFLIEANLILHRH
jgi:hypothetical protein